MIERDEVVRWARAWGVAEAQVVKDHLISHLLHGLDGFSGVTFFGGTAINRTFVADRRVSEDIDLFIDPRHPTDPDAVIAAIAGGTRREFPDLRLEPVRQTADVRTFAAVDSDTTVQVQIVGPRHEHKYVDVAPCLVRLRYSDLPDAVGLAVPTLPAFGAMKLAAWEERHAPRDLFDLDSLEKLGGLGDDAIAALRSLRGSAPVRAEYEPARCPSPDTWNAELGHQTTDLSDPADILERVRDALFPNV
ncbi:MAG: nucleotidyl transferase AbiEii/AbiGii toxin family protein [Acidimicrobiia bacterium]